MDPKSPKGNPLIFDKLTPELAGKLVEWVGDDMKRAKREAEEKQKKREAEGRRAKVRS